MLSQRVRSELAEAGLLLVWVVHVVLFVFFVPAWQHYDEPTHLEYALLIAELGRVPDYSENVPTVRQAIATAMLDAGFFQHAQPTLPAPDPNNPNLSIGFNQRTHPALYYQYIATVLRPLQPVPMTTLLLIARLCSAFLAAVLFYSVVQLLRLMDLVNDTRIAVLALLALHPVFADTMSSVNSDVLANVVAVWLLISAVGFVRQPHWRWILVGIGLSIVAWKVKRVAVVATFVVPVAWLLVAPKRVRRWSGVAAGALILGFSLIGQQWSVTLASWETVAAQDVVTTTIQPYKESIQPHTGRMVFQLERPDTGPGIMLQQEIDPFLRDQTAGKIVTLAGWMRADRDGLLAFTPGIQANQTLVHDSVYIGTEWKYVATSLSLPKDTSYLAVRLSGPLTTGIIYYDSLTLIEGTAPGDAFLADGMLEAELLPENVPHNLLRNTGAEQHIPSLPSTVWNITNRFIPAQNLNRILETLTNRAWQKTVYPRQALALFQGFWGHFGWGEISTPAGWFTSIGLLVMLCLIGGIRQTWLLWYNKDIHGDSTTLRLWVLCLAAVAIGWGMALLRVHIQPIPGAFVWSFGRYTFISFVPSLILFTIGLETMLPQRLRRQGMVGIILFIFLFSVITLTTTLMPYWATFSGLEGAS